MGLGNREFSKGKKNYKEYLRNFLWASEHTSQVLEPVSLVTTLIIPPLFLSKLIYYTQSHILMAWDSKKKCIIVVTIHKETWCCWKEVMTRQEEDTTVETLGNKISYRDDSSQRTPFTLLFASITEVPCQRRAGSHFPTLYSYRKSRPSELLPFCCMRDLCLSCSPKKSHWFNTSGFCGMMTVLCCLKWTTI